jgi:hypothetical protein
MVEEPTRYYFLGAGTRTAETTQLRALIIIGLSVAVAVLSRDLFVLILASIFAIVGLVSLLRPGRPGLYVELRDDSLIVKLLVATRVPFSSIARVEHPIATHGTLMRAITNGAVAMNRIAGGDYPWARPRGEMDTTTCRLLFRKVVWVPVVIPPLFIPRRSWSLTVEDAESLKAEIEKRITA